MCYLTIFSHCVVPACLCMCMGVSVCMPLVCLPACLSDCPPLCLCACLQVHGDYSGEDIGMKVERPAEETEAAAEGAEAEAAA